MNQQFIIARNSARAMDSKNNMYVGLTLENLYVKIHIQDL